MKTIDDVRNWILGAEAEFEDPAEPVGQIFARFATAPDSSDEITAVLDRTADGPVLMLKLGGNPPWLPLPIDADGMVFDQETGRLLRFGVKQICPGVWTVEPSLNMPGQIHAFLIIFGVPDPAPWERMIITPNEFRAQMQRRF